MPSTRRTLLLIALTAAGLAAAARADDLTTTGGKKLSGKLQAIDAQGATFLAGEAKVTVPGKDIVVVDLGNKVAPPPKEKDGKPARFSEVELTDGSTFRAKKDFAVRGRKLEAELATVPDGVPAPAFELPLSAVFSVMRGADDPKMRDGWKKVLAARGKRDLYVTLVPAGHDFTQGTILSGTEDGLDLEFEQGDGTKVKLRQNRATGGLVFAHPTPAQVPPTLCKVLDVFGNSLVARAVELSPEGVVTVTTVAGVAVRYPSAAGIAKFDYAQGNVAYLSDLDPVVDAPPVPADEKGLRLNVAAPFVRDQGVAGEPLKLGTDPPFPKGLVVAPDTALTFAIGGDYREFKAVAGVPENSPDANLEAKLTIEADGKAVFSEVLRRKAGPRPITLDVKGVKQLRVIVEADLPVNGNRVILADARVQK